MNQYCMYLRKSRADAEAEARGEGETLSRHRKMLVDLAHRQGMRISKEYAEVVSGETIASRPMMQQLLADVEQGIWAGVLVVEVERLARGDSIDQGLVAQTFKLSDTKIITPAKTYDPANEFDEEYFEFGLFMSRREYKTINRRLQNGRLASIREGKYVASRPPFGYVRRKLENDKGFTLVPHPEQAEVVRMIFDWYTKGVEQYGEVCRIGVGLIARRLNTLKIPPARGDVWVTPSVRDILINPVYIGKLRWNWRPANKKMVGGQIETERPRSKEYLLVDGLHPAIIDPEIFDLAQRFMTQNPPRPIGESKKVTNPLAGLVVCGKCGRIMQRRPYSGRQPDTLLCAVTACENVSSALHIVESRILESLAEWISEYKLKWESYKAEKPPQTSYTQKAITKLDAEISELHTQLSNVHDLLERGVYDDDTFISRSASIKERISQAEAEKAKLADYMKNEKLRETARAEFIPKVEHLLEVYNELPTAAAKNNMLKEVLEKVMYLKDSAARWQSPEQFDIKLYPKIPRENELR